LNPIISAAALVPVLFLWRGKFVPESRDDKPPLKEVLANFDYPGMIVFAAAIVALLLGLQFGSTSYSWSDGRTIASLTVAGVLSLIFVAIEWGKGNNAIVPRRIIRNRVVSLSSIYTSTLDGAYFVMTYQVCGSLQPKLHSVNSSHSRPRRFPCGSNQSLASLPAILVFVFFRSSHFVSSQSWRAQR